MKEPLPRYGDSADDLRLGILIGRREAMYALMASPSALLTCTWARSGCPRAASGSGSRCRGSSPPHPRPEHGVALRRPSRRTLAENDLVLSGPG